MAELDIDRLATCEWLKTCQLKELNGSTTLPRGITYTRCAKKYATSELSLNRIETYL